MFEGALGFSLHTLCAIREARKQYRAAQEWGSTELLVGPPANRLRVIGQVWHSKVLFCTNGPMGKVCTTVNILTWVSSGFYLCFRGAGGWVGSEGQQMERVMDGFEGKGKLYILVWGIFNFLNM